MNIEEIKSRVTFKFSEFSNLVTYLRNQLTMRSFIFKCIICVTKHRFRKTKNHYIGIRHD